jgi:hypothetical protein
MAEPFWYRRDLLDHHLLLLPSTEVHVIGDQLFRSPRYVAPTFLFRTHTPRLTPTGLPKRRLPGAIDSNE